MILFIIVRFNEIDYLVTGIQRRLVAKLKRFNHIQSALFVFAEMFRRYVIFVSLFACVSFKNSYLARVFLVCNGIHGQYSRLCAQGNFANLACKHYIIRQDVREVPLFLKALLFRPSAWDV